MTDRNSDEISTNIEILDETDAILKSKHKFMRHLAPRSY